MPSVSIFGGAPRTVSIVVREQFTGDGSDKTFQLDGSMGNCTLDKGTWAASQIQTAYPAHVTGTDKAPTYDSVNPITRNRVGVTSIDGTGLVTLDYAPRDGVSFYIWYWYQLGGNDEITYYREDFVASMEEQGATIGSSITLDTTNFDGILSAADSDVQTALDTIDDHTHSLDEITNPAADKTFQMTTRQISFLWTTPPGHGLILEASGAFSDEILHIHQHTGNPAAGTHLVKLESVDTDVHHILSEGPNATIHSYASQVTGDADHRFNIQAGGTLEWGDGTNPVDTNLYRSAADTLKTDDAFYAVGNISTDGTVDGVDIAAFYSAYGSHTHDDRYYTETELDAGQLDNRYYTETEIDAFSFITAAGVTYENLNANSDVGTGAAQVAQGSHLHDGQTLQCDGITSDAATFQLTVSTIQIGPAADPDALKLDSNKDFYIIDGNLYVDNSTGGIARVYLGSNNTRRASISLYGAGTGEINGGAIYLYTAADHDTYIDYYGIAIYQDDFRVGPPGASDLFKMVGGSAAHDVSEVVFNEAGNDVDFRVEASGVASALFVQGSDGSIGIGENTPTYTLDVYKANTVYIRAWTNAVNKRVGAIYANDGQSWALGVDGQDTDKFKIAYGGDLTGTNLFQMSTGEICFNEGGADVDFRVEASGFPYALFVEGSSGIVSLGQADTTQGVLYLHGNNASTGSEIRLYQPANDDAVVDYYTIWAEDGNLYIGPNTDTDALKLDSNKDLYLTDGDIYVQSGGTTVFQTIAGSVLVGTADTTQGSMLFYSNGTGQPEGGLMIFTVAPDYDNPIAEYYLQAYEDDLLIGPDTNPDMFKLDGDAGVVAFGTHTALGAETVTGYITIKDEAGNTRKLAVVS